MILFFRKGTGIVRLFLIYYRINRRHFRLIHLNNYFPSDFYYKNETPLIGEYISVFDISPYLISFSH